MSLREFASALRSALLFWPVSVLWTLVVNTASMAVSPFDRSGRIQHHLVRLWSGFLLKLYRMPVTVCGLDRLDLRRARIYAANHLSALDIPVLYRHLPFQFRIIAHRWVFRVPLLGWYLRSSGQLEIYPESVASTRTALREAVKTLQRGMPLVIFPEGTRSPTGELQPFRRGTFYVAVEAQTDVVPVAISGTYEILPLGSAHFRPGPVRLSVGEPIPVSGYTDRDLAALAERTQKAVEELLRQD